MSPFWWLTILGTLALILLAIGQMQRHALFGRYPLVGLFLAGLLLTSCAQIGQIMKVYELDAAGYKTMYWTSEFVSQFLLTLAMISLIYRALDGAPDRVRVLGWVVLIVAASALITLFGASAAASWRRLLVRNLSFGSALLNVFLWRSMLKRGRSDVQLLLLAIGVGFWTTGKAIGKSLTMMDAKTRTAGDLVVVFTEILCLLVWVWALGMSRRQQQQFSATPPQATPA